jgi:hypothetical protein
MMARPRRMLLVTRETDVFMVDDSPRRSSNGPWRRRVAAHVVLPLRRALGPPQRLIEQISRTQAPWGIRAVAREVTFAAGVGTSAPTL